MKNKYRSIIIEGPIGVGKTTLATKLASSLESKLMLESFSENPFLEKFYIRMLVNSINIRKQANML